MTRPKINFMDGHGKVLLIIGVHEAQTRRNVS